MPGHNKVSCVDEMQHIPLSRSMHRLVKPVMVETRRRTCRLSAHQFCQDAQAVRGNFRHAHTNPLSSAILNTAPTRVFPMPILQSIQVLIIQFYLVNPTQMWADSLKSTYIFSCRVRSTHTSIYISSMMLVTVVSRCPPCLPQLPVLPLPVL